MASQLHREKEVAIVMLSRGIRVAVAALDNVWGPEDMTEYATKLSNLHGVLRKSRLWAASPQSEILLHELKSDVDTLFKFSKHGDVEDATGLRESKRSVMHIIDLLATMQEATVNG